MRHPFAGIVGHNLETSITRRTALASAAAAAAMLSSGNLLAEEEPKEEAAVEGEPARSLYLVVPKEPRGFRAVATKLGVNGPYTKGLPGSEAYKDKAGMLTWSTAEEAKAIADSEDIAEVHQITAADKMRPEKLGDRSSIVMVMLAPNSWPKKPDEGTFVDAEKIAETWTADEKLKDLGVEIKAPKAGALVQIGIKDPENLDAVLEVVLAHPQVFGAMADAVATTLAIGEEGGGAVTTQAIGEEGGATTKAIGEEGGPRPSTRALGEEGGRIEATTFALGEEGGPVPVPAPITTQALGEEGGGLR